ncbi:MAG: hypothetical protein FJW22_13300 [Acidimicrobiia bacterium]|nr:hypothetical protein [Acidimicrobiia bacterium]
MKRHADRPQARAIERIAGLLQMFHGPYPTNYVYQLVPLRRDLDIYLRRLSGTRAGWAKINAADKALRAICEQDADDKRLGPRNARAQGALRDWAATAAVGRNLRCVDHAERYTRARHGADPAFCVWLRRKAPTARAQFKKLPRSLLGQVRINLYLSEQDAHKALTAICAELAKRRGLIERIEISITGIEKHESTYPTLIIYLRSARSVPRVTAELGPVLSKFRARRVREEYAQPWLRQGTITQGFRLYKRYLKLLGLLDVFYDPTTNHALCKTRRMEKRDRSGSTAATQGR